MVLIQVGIEIMNVKYGVKVVSANGAVEWVMVGMRYAFTKSKAQFILESVIKRGLSVRSTISVEAIRY